MYKKPSADIKLRALNKKETKTKVNSGNLCGSNVPGPINATATKNAGQY